MIPEKIIAFVSQLPGVVVHTASEERGAPRAAWGDTFIFYDPDDSPQNRQPGFATIVVSDYPGFDTFAMLDRPGVFRLNLIAFAPPSRSFSDIRPPRTPIITRRGTTPKPTASSRIPSVPNGVGSRSSNQGMPPPTGPVRCSSRHMHGRSNATAPALRSTMHRVEGLLHGPKGGSTRNTSSAWLVHRWNRISGQWRPAPVAPGKAGSPSVKSHSNGPADPETATPRHASLVTARSEWTSMRPALASIRRGRHGLGLFAPGWLLRPRRTGLDA